MLEEYLFALEVLAVPEVLEVHVAPVALVAQDL